MIHHIRAKLEARSEVVQLGYCSDCDVDWSVESIIPQHRLNQVYIMNKGLTGLLTVCSDLMSIIFQGAAMCSQYYAADAPSQDTYSTF